jgi:hypothetical protein
MSIGDLEYDYRAFNSRFSGDEALLVKFYMDTVEDKAESKKEGRPIFKEVEFVDIRIPGDRNAICRPARDYDKNRFREHYRRFKDRVEGDDQIVGTLLTEWPPIPRSMCEELAFFHVKTVEQLANMSDSQASRFMGINKMRARAKQWLENAEKQKPIDELQDKLDEQNSEIAELKAALNNLMAVVDSEGDDEDLTAAQKTRRKRRAVNKAKEKVD